MVAPVKNGNAHRGHGGGGGGGRGGRPYGLMLLLALGAAILGVLVLHKLREGRLFSLLVKEKDHELLSLHLLLLKEREFSKEAQKRLEEMKTNLYSAKVQKSDVDGRLLEVESLVSSLKDEQKILESQLEEKRNEINMLRQQQRMMPNEEIRFRDTSNLNRGEIEDLKNNHLEKSAAGVWSVSSDDPSNPPINFTNAVKAEQSGEMGLPGGSEEGAYQNKNETDIIPSVEEKRKLEDTGEEGKPVSISNEKESFQGQSIVESGQEKAFNSAADHVMETEKQSGELKHSEDGSGSSIRVKHSKQRKLRKRRWRDLIKRVREEKNGHLEQNEVKASENNVEPRKEELVKMAENVMQSSSDVNLETKEPEQNSSAGKVEVESSKKEEEQAREQKFDEDGTQSSGGEDKQNEKGFDHGEDEEQTNSSKDDEHKTN